MTEPEGPSHALDRPRKAEAKNANLVRFIVRRVLWLIPILVVAVVVTFTLMHLAPGSPWNVANDSISPSVQLSEASIRQLDAKYGLDEPWWEQLVIYLGNVVTLDLGDSYTYQGREVSELIGESLPTTAALGLITLAVIVPVGVGLGVVAAVKHNSALDYAVTGLATLGASVPNFVVGIFLIMTLSVGLNQATNGSFFLPAGGFGIDLHLVLPVITLSLLPVAFLARLTRSEMLEALRQDHVRTARAKGVPERRVLSRHALKTALIPVITVLGPMFTFLITGTVVIESLFQIPGLGGAFVQAIGQRDYPVILGGTVVYALIVAVANLVVDGLYRLIDPRVTLS